MEIIHQQVQRKKEKMARLADLQRQIDEATEEVRHLVQDEQDRRPQHRELHQEGLFNDDGWYDDFNHDTFTLDDASPLAAELQAIPWPPSYKPPQLPMYDGHSDPKQFLMSYEATISSYGGNAAVQYLLFSISLLFKGLRPGPTVQYFARKPPQTLEKLLQKMDEYIRADNDFRQRREEAYRFSEMTRGFGGRIHPRHVRSIHNST
jgi:hypothetical protein